MSSQRSALLGLALLAGCSDSPPEAPPVAFVGLRDGAVLGGPQTTTVDPAITAGALRVELFLDDDRIGAAEFAPFSVEWDTTAFDEGNAELRAVVDVADASTVDARIGIVIDNTPPVVEGLPENLEPGDLVELQVADANRIVHVELAGPPGLEHSWEAPPFTLEWTEECGAADVTITAIDEAGWSTTLDDAVQTFLPTDHDCDGYAPDLIVGGTDCDDADPLAHPGAVDRGPDGDLNCDGVPGTDADGDRVASTQSGGRDCNDADPEIHPDAFLYGRQPLEIDGRPVLWEPGTAANVATSKNGLDVTMIAINRAGTLELVTAPWDGSATRRVLLDGVTPGMLAFNVEPFSGGRYIVYARGRDVRALFNLGDESWTDERVMLLDQDPDELVTSGAYQEPAVAVRAGSSIHLARRIGDWQSQVVETDAALVQAPINLVADGFLPDATFHVSYVVAGSLRRASFSSDSTTPDFASMGPVQDSSAMVGLCYVPSIDTAFYGAAGCVMRSGSREPILDCGAAIERLFCARDTFYFQPSSGVVGRYGPGNALEYISAVADSAFAYGELEPGEFVSPGSIYRWVNYVAAPDDPVDGVDRDCDGLDD